MTAKLLLTEIPGCGKTTSVRRIIELLRVLRLATVREHLSIALEASLLSLTRRGPGGLGG